MVLILSSDADAHVPLVACELEARGVDVLCFDPGRFPAEARMSFRLDSAGVQSRLLEVDGRRYDLANVHAVWNRRPTLPVPAATVADQSVRTYIEFSARHFLDGFWETLPCRWVPATPVVDRAAQNKLRQLRLAIDVGLRVPDTLICNDPRTFAEFYSDSSDIVSKTLVQRPLALEDGVRPSMFTTPVRRRHLRRYQDVRHGPVVFQQYAHKAVEVRATIIGNRIYSAAIHSQERRSTRHDWRHYHERVRYEPHALPAATTAALLQMTNALGLRFGAADLVLTPEGEYIFLEINPNGQWGFVEKLAGLPLAAALADLLAVGS